MKKLIKMICITLLLCVSFSLVSCTGSSSLIYMVDNKAIEVELINYDNPEVRNNPSENQLFEFSRLEVIETLDVEKHEKFLQELNIRVHMKMTRKQKLFSHDGVGLRITYDDNSFQIITLTNIKDKYYIFVGKYDSSGTVKASKDVEMIYATERFIDVINKYFATQI